MKMSKKITALLSAFALLCSGVSAQVPEKTEIKFAVGDETLLINGEAVKVEKPYVVGEGVTLVPLRVITEAFGAEVEWIAETRTVKLTYPDVNIELQIDNPVAEVNKRAETLLSAPEITNNVTMVPLRFISETFGAEVSYDNETRAISVVKDNSQKEEQSTIVGEISEKYIGDSYYGWKMENPKDMSMAERSFSGDYTEFAKDENNYFYVAVIPMEDDYDFEKDFISTKNSFQGYTLMKAEKNTDNPDLKYMNFQVKDNNTIMAIKYFVTPEYLIDVCGFFSTETPGIKDECMRIMETFECKFEDTDTYDLSNVKDGKREFKAENMKYSLEIPENFEMVTSEDVETEVRFMSTDTEDSVSMIALHISSVSEADAKTLAEKDRSSKVKAYNENIAVVSELSEKEYDKFNAVEYSVEVKNSHNGDHVMRDVFFEAGEYVYNIAVKVKTPNDKADEIINTVIASLDFTELDPEEVGIIMRNDYDAEGTYTSKTDKWSMVFPYTYEESGKGDEYGTYINNKSGIIIAYALIEDPNANYVNLKNEMKNIELAQKSEEGVEVVKSTVEETIGSVRYVNFELSTEEEEGKVYVRNYLTIAKNKVHNISVIIPELTYSKTNLEEIDAILSSFRTY